MQVSDGHPTSQRATFIPVLRGSIADPASVTASPTRGSWTQMGNVVFYQLIYNGSIGQTGAGNAFMSTDIGPGPLIGDPEYGFTSNVTLNGVVFSNPGQAIAFLTPDGDIELFTVDQTGVRTPLPIADLGDGFSIFISGMYFTTKPL